MTTPNYTTLFNNHFMELVNNIIEVFPGNVDLVTTKNFLEMTKRANPKLIMKFFAIYVTDKYGTEIESGDINFFIDKDYTQDLTHMKNSDKINDSIDKLRTPIRLMNKNEQQKVVKYLQNLKKIIDLSKQSTSAK